MKKPARKSGRWRRALVAVALFVVLAIGGWIGVLLRQMHLAKELKRAWEDGDVIAMNSLIIDDRWIRKTADNGTVYYTLERAAAGKGDDQFYDPATPGVAYIYPSDRVIPYDLADFLEFEAYYLAGKREILVAPNRNCEGRFSVNLHGVFVDHIFTGLEAVKKGSQ